ncbi:MAG: histidine phosphatase family protein [Rhodospirillales bacterium]|nr:histidine phosphatase family protein [Rhodospirillales bacterium]
MTAPMRPTEWWWVRHAPVIGPAGCIHGQHDVACDLSDRDCLAALARALPDDAVWLVTSLRRTRDTAAAIAAMGKHVPEPIVEPDFVEQSFGRWQGLNWEEMQERDPAAYDAFWQDPTRNPPPGGESFAAQMTRVAGAINRRTTEFAGRRVVSISHGGTIRAAVAAALALAPEAAMAVVIDTLSVTRFSFVEDGLLRGRGGVWLVQGVNAPCRWDLGGGK